MSESPVEKMSFEQAMTELEQVVKTLEAGDVALEDSIRLYERGDALRKRCEAQLQAAEEKIAAITTDASGAATGTKPFDAE
ncbi:exodeoxyribonuclease VII small subunit [Tropicimonas sp. IMCC6043]|uniref:exodeoxyribonuclease VII small subunit n=1 Tax=Tropicimonas sp. IMCC6043 TaxID=2510645 RepID=UPI00101BDD29|nr:exodeoxyribonuclease VII small subunit [Tropicimonas sp. IMCC6043]RYH09978.1 exodeoxyribonuclease VII small subunit [Tropicimonas sp. IMCC6043]